MSIRSTRLSSSRSRLQKLRRERQHRLKTRRDLNLENLEDRRVMAGLQLAGIATNQGSLLRPDSTLTFNEAPKELVFRFNDGALVNPAALASGIEIVRSGGDGSFETASVRSDLNTNGAVVMEFSAIQAHSAGDGITLVFSKNARGVNGGVGIEVNGAQIKIDLNTSTGAHSTAFDLRAAINSHPQASQLIRASVLRGSAFTDISVPAINYSPLTLTGANKATGTSNFNQGSTVEIEFTAVAEGISGNGVQLNFTQRDFGGAGAPRITVSGRRINVELNSRVGSETTAAALVGAINTDPAASQLVRARQTVGRSTAKITSALPIAPVVLTGANDIVITPGFVGLGESPNIGVVRFAETLVDDFYRVNILGRPGAGHVPVSESDGDIFRNGEGNTQITFELDLGAQVISVVPQPITRNAGGQLQQARNQIHVYFNDDDLDRTAAENVNFYELISTENTVRNTDDLSFRPVQVRYDAAADRAILTFAADLDNLMGGASTFRLRIGTDEALPIAPQLLATGADIGSSFDTSMNLDNTFETGAVLLVREDGRSLVDGQTISIVSRAGAIVTLEFEDIFDGPGGVRSGNVAVPFTDNSTAEDIAQAIATAINDVNAQQNNDLTANSNGNLVFLQNDERITFSAAIRAISKSSQSLVISSSIDNSGQPYNLQFPGAITEPGHREIPVENHFQNGADSTPGITTAFYNFQDFYGFDPEGNALRNAITEVQKQRIREIFQLYSQYMGIQFVESAFQGMTIAVGDMRAADETVETGPGGTQGVAVGGVTGLLVMDLQDFDNQNDEFGQEFYRVAMHEIGHLLGFGHGTELPALTVMSGSSQSVTARAEAVAPGDHDITHGQFLYRPESKDIDLYRFVVPQKGLFTAETIAERLLNSSLLDTTLTLYRETPEGREVVARNEDYFSKDSYLELLLDQGVYFVGVTANGNAEYDPSIEDSGIGGRTEGRYELLLNFRGESTNGIVDADNRTNPAASPTSAATLLDGDADGTPGGVFNFWFRSQDPSNTIYVDKVAQASGANGTLARPYNNIATALAAAQFGDIVRIVGNGGADGDITTLEDNRAYEIGFSALSGRTLADGATLEVPRGVTVMVESGAMIKVRRARIGVGSSSTSVDLSGSALQVLGVPKVIDSAGNVRLDSFEQPIAGNVIFTSLHDTIGITTNPDSSPPAAAAGDWGGIAFRSDLDHRNPNRLNYEKQGIFLNSVVHADIRFGGGNVTVNGTPTVVDPIYIADSRPTVAYSTVTRSAHAAISANPNSFEESNFHSPDYQVAGSFTSDYSRIGPDIHGNRVTDSTLNGLFVRVRTAPGATPEQLTLAGRWNDTEMVHVLQENLTVAGTPGGPVLESVAPPVVLVTVEPGSVGGTLTAGTYNYVLTFVDANGNEGPASDVTASATIPGNPDITDSPNVGTVQLGNLPSLSIFPNFVARRLYRSTPSGTGPYTLVAQLNATDEDYLDTGVTIGGSLQAGQQVIRARQDGRLRMDPGLVVKSQGSVIELGMGANLIAEGNDGERVVMTSLTDRRYGAGGTFNTNSSTGIIVPSVGEWGGIFAGPTSRVNLDYSLFAFGGGTVRLEGGFRSFNALEIHQAAARVSNSIFEFNADGFEPVDNDENSIETRFGRGFNRSAVIFVRGAQPVIIDNIIRDNQATAISINANSLNGYLVNDLGRATGEADLYTDVFGNRGPLVDGNRLDNNTINGMDVRAATLTTEGVWDDTDIVHVVTGNIEVSNFHTFGGLQLVSKATESLVVKLKGDDAGFTASGKPLDIDDRIGGSLQLIGHPRHPVVFTSLHDCTAGAGFTPDGTPQTDTDNTGSCGDEVGPSSPYVDVIVVMDESASMGFAQQFSVQLITDLDATLISLGIGDGTLGINQFGLVGYGSAIDDPRSYLMGANQTLFGSSADYAIAAQGLTVDGALEDGWQAMDFAIDNYAMRPDATKFVLLVTNEDRDENDPNASFANTLAKIQGAGATLEGILDIDIVDGNGATALAIDADGNAYLADGAGGFTTSPGGSIQNAFGTTQTDYAAMVFATDGLAGDINQIQSGGDVATSFGRAMISKIVQTVGGSGSQAGDWRGLSITEYASDRNVDPIAEIEPFDSVIDGTNGTTTRSEFLGELAPHEKGGDDNLRLGFVVNGAINNRADVDVYRFTAETGTEVWIDIDRTTHSLDSVVELIAADGTVLARSDNSGAELANPGLLFRDSSVPANHINPLQKSVFDGEDRYTTNPRDAGMRVLLPGGDGVRGTYYVRVRSAGNDINDLGDGLTRGVYQLQVRLRELDEQPGSTIRSADIRFADTGVQVLGQPIHSPLLGEIAEDTSANDSGAAAQRIGNVLNTDRATMSIAGSLSASSDVDVFQFETRYTDVEKQSTPANPQYVATTFDIDYADGLGRPNTTLAVFDENGNLVLIAQDSNVSEDLPGPGSGANMDDLTRGGVGYNDPFLGSVELPVGSYFAGVSSTSQIPTELGQFFQPNPLNPLLRLEPIDTTRRLAEDHIGSSGGSTADAPVIPVLIDDSSKVPWNLGDLSLYVSEDDGGADTTDIHIVNPLTGRQLTQVGQFGFDVGDIAFMPNGDLMSYSLDLEVPPSDDASTGFYLRIDDGNAAVTQLGEAGIETYHSNGANPPAAQQSEHGIHFEAITFGNVGDGILRGFAVGNRPQGVNPPGIPLTRNILYTFVPTTGTAFSAPAQDRTTDADLLNPSGAGTQIRERGVLNTSADGGPGGDITGIAFIGSQMWAVSSNGGLYRVRNYDSPEGASLDYVNTATDLLGIRFSGLAAGPRNTEDGRFATMLFGIDLNGELYAFDRSGDLQPVFSDGQTSVGTGITGAHGIAFSTLDTNLWHSTEVRAGDAGHGLNVPFDGSRAAQPGGTSFWFGWENQSSNQVIQDPFFDHSNNFRDYDFPGGAHGALVSHEIDLTGYAPQDAPTLYFNYRLRTENAAATLDTRFMRDAFRVYAAGEDGRWHLMATNNSSRGSGAADDEFDNFSGLGINVQELFDVADRGAPDSWRQARVPLNVFAGQKNVRLRFEFSTAASFDVGNPSTTGDVLQAISGQDLRDGRQVRIDADIFEFDLGATLVAATGADIQDAETFTIDGNVFEFDKLGNGVFPGRTAIVVDSTMTAEEVAQRMETAIQAVGGVTPRRHDNRIQLDGATIVFQSAGAATFIDGRAGVTPGALSMKIHADMTAEQVALVVQKALADRYADGEIGSFPTDRERIQVVEHNVVNRGPLGLAPSLTGDQFGSFFARTLSNGATDSNNPGPLMAQNNDFEGVYLDDLIIGFAERGEMATGAVRNSTYIANPTAPANQINVGEYQLEIRRSAEFGTADPAPVPTLILDRSIDTNDRLAQSHTLHPPSAAEVVDGQTFSLYDGINTVTFEYEDVNIGNGVAQGRIPVRFDPSAPDGRGGVSPESRNILGARIRDLINSAAVQNVLAIEAAFSDGEDIGSISTDSDINLFGNALVIAGIPFTEWDDFGDQNLFRDQGQVLISSSRISQSANFGLEVNGGRRDGPEGNTHQAPPRVTREINSQKWTPGVVIENNVIFNNGDGGIRFTGVTATGTEQVGAIPFGRIINNTLYGRSIGDIGILVQNNASPTLLNNIVANFELGISIDASSSSTVLGSTLYQSNDTNSDTTLGSFAIELLPGDPLFVDPARGNFYLAPGSLAIDSGISSLNDRTPLISVRGPLGIPVSPILAPTTDALGQLRVDDPTVEPPPGAGENVFIDRGAIDRADFAGPIAVALDPRDNDSQGKDLDPRETFVKLSVVSVNGFSIQLQDGVEPIDPVNGSGIDDATVTRDQVTLLRDGVRLVEGVDYRFRYDALNDVIRLTPIAGIFETNHTYVIELANHGQFVITAPAGDQVADGDSFDITDELGNTANFEYEAGYTVTVAPTLVLVMPQAGGGLGGVTDRQRFTVTDGTKTVTLEFDNNGSVAAGNIAIVFTPQTSSEQLAQAVVAALIAADIGLAPLDLGRGRVHVGALPNHVVDISGAFSLRRTGSETGGVFDGDTFRLDDGTTVITYEIDFDGDVTSGRTVINILQQDTHEVIADKIVAAIRANQTLTPVHLGDGLIHLGGSLLTLLDTTGSQLTQTGTPGVRSEFGILIPSSAGLPVGIRDGLTFRLGDGVQLPVTFEFDSNGRVVPGNTVVAIPAVGATLDQIANAMVQAIASVGIGLSPTNAGNGRVILNDDTPRHFFQALTSGMTRLGTPGVDGAVAVNFVPDDAFTAQTMADQIAQLIDSNTTLVGVTSFARDDQIVVDGAANVQGIVQVFVAGIADIAGNVLRANQPTGETRFTILLGSGFDFGDAPSIRNYPTLLSQNGARHLIVPGFSLGAAADIDVDGQPTNSSDGDDTDSSDDEDGVTVQELLRGYGSSITINATGVTPTRSGFVDAWVDWNADGDWNDSNEKLLSSVSVLNGDNTFNFTVPVNAAVGPTFVRVRYSSTGGLSPVGEAVDGEVEDHRIIVNASPWQNFSRPADVNGDGKVQPFDVLQIVSFLIKYGSQSLPVPPPFVAANGDRIFPTGRMIDTDGNTRVEPFDALIVVNAIRTGNGEGSASGDDEAEGEGSGSTRARSLSASSATSSTATSSTATSASGLDAWAAPLIVASTVSTTEIPQTTVSAPASSSVREVTFTLPKRSDAEVAQQQSFATEDDSLEDLLDAIVEDRGGTDEQLRAHDLLFADL